jgi:glycogen synthase
MRVLFISNLYPPHDLGGWEQNCHEIALRLKAGGHVCHVLTSRYGLSGRTSVEEGVTRALHLEAGINYYRPLDFFLRRPGRERANREALRAVLATFRPDVVFIWGMWLLSTRVAYEAEQLMPGRVAYAIAGYWPMQPDAHETYWRRPGHNPLANALLAPLRFLALRAVAREKEKHPLRLAQVACVSRYVREKLCEAGVLPNGVRVIYNGIDPQPFSTRPPQARMVVVTGCVWSTRVGYCRRRVW